MSALIHRNLHKDEYFDPNIADWKKLKNIAIKKKLYLIEDSADTLGAKINNVSTGTYSDISITSFYGSHVISCAGNGGMLLTNDKKIYVKSKVLEVGVGYHH